jgi:nitrite reductase/ring-hydroxylating ferredoxin subunit
MRAVAIEQAVAAAGIAVEHEVFTEQAHRQRGALVQLGHGGDRLPVAAHQLAHRRAAADAGQGLVVLGAQHGLSGRYDTVSPGGPAMLSHEDNELLCRIGPGTPMGNLMRQYWVPAALSSELPEPDGPLLRVRLLGEDLIGFRTTSGAVGLLPNSCPHRGASLFYGRNEDDGLRCVYHGWKFDVTGQCVDMPSEPIGTTYQSKVRAKAYPCVERGGVIWAYLGPRSTPPPLPDLEPNMLAGSTLQIYQRECNWVQALEGDIDTCHTVFLHLGHVAADDTPPGRSPATR